MITEPEPFRTKQCPLSRKTAFCFILFVESNSSLNMYFTIRGLKRKSDSLLFNVLLRCVFRLALFRASIAWNSMHWRLLVSKWFSSVGRILRKVRITSINKQKSISHSYISIFDVDKQMNKSAKLQTICCLEPFIAVIRITADKNEHNFMDYLAFN